MKKRLIIIMLLSILLVGCSGEFGLRSKGKYAPSEEKFHNKLEETSFSDNQAVNFGKYNSPISEDISSAYRSYQQLCICVKCLIKV